MVLAGCGRVAFEPLDDGSGAPDSGDLCAVERTAQGPFGMPRMLAEIATAKVEDDPVLSPDGLELYFASNRDDSVGGQDIYVTRRENRTDTWGAVERIANLSSTENDNTPALSSDGLEMWLASDRPGGVGGEDIWVSVRGSITAPWPTPSLVRELSSPSLDRGPAPCGRSADCVALEPLARAATPTLREYAVIAERAWTTPVPLRTLNTPTPRSTRG